MNQFSSIFLLTDIYKTYKNSEIYKKKKYCEIFSTSDLKSTYLLKKIGNVKKFNINLIFLFNIYNKVMNAS